MKKFFVYCVVLIGMLSIGMMTYYLLRNNEVISITHAESEPIYMNKGETRELPYEWDKPHRDTVLEIYTMQPNLLEVNMEENTMTALAGGTADLIITSSNSKYINYRFSIIIGDGTQDNPWLISKRSELKQIGSTKYKLSDEYIVTSDIDLKSTEDWIPIGTVLDEQGVVTEQKEFTGKMTTGGLTRTFSGLRIVENSYEYAGLFAKLGAKAIIEDIKISGVTISSANEYVGAVAGVNHGSLYRVEVFTQNTSGLGGISSTFEGANVGGIVGANLIGNFQEGGTIQTTENSLDKARIEMVGFEGKLTADVAANVGGLAGYMAGGRLYNTYANVEFIGTTADVNFGAMIGFANSSYVLYSADVGIASKAVYPLLRDSYAVLVGSSVASVSNNYGIIGLMNYSEAAGEIGDLKNTIAGIYFCTPAEGGFENSSFKTFATNRLVVRTSDPSDLQGTDKIDWKSIAEELQVFVTVIGSSRTNWSIGLPNNLDKVWRIDTGKYPYFNFNGRSSDLDFDEDSFAIYNLTDLKKYQSLINTSGDGGKVNSFWADQSYILYANSIDLAGEEWTPIGTDYQPFTGKFKASKTGTHVIKNFKITTVARNRVSNGFFSVIDNYAVVEGVDFEDVTISNGVYVGVVAGFNSGSIIDCSVNNVTLSVKDNLGQEVYDDISAGTISTDLLNARFIGFITGYNDGLTGRGIITASEIITTQTNELTGIETEVVSYKGLLGADGGIMNINAKLKTTYAGGVAGMNNTGKITNIKIDSYFEINADAISTEITIPFLDNTGKKVNGGIYHFIGGITGRNAGGIEDLDQVNLDLPDGIVINAVKGQIINCAVEGGIITDNSVGQLFIGGITALNQKGGVIEQSHAGGNTALTLKTTSSRAEQKEVGGIVGVNYGAVARSFSNVNMSGISEDGLYYAGGIAAINFKGGYITECYSQGTAEGSILGGLTVINQGKITNCYSSLSMKGTKRDSVMAGLSTYIPEGGEIKFCLVMSSFSGDGKKYAETSSNFKGNIYTVTAEKLFNATGRYNLYSNKVGYIESIVIDKDMAAGAIMQNTAGFGDLYGLIKAQNGHCVFYMTTIEMTDPIAEKILRGADINAGIGGNATIGANFGSQAAVWSWGVSGRYFVLKNIGKDGTLDNVVQHADMLGDIGGDDESTTDPIEEEDVA